MAAGINLTFFFGAQLLPCLVLPYVFILGPLLWFQSRSLLQRLQRSLPGEEKDGDRIFFTKYCQGVPSGPFTKHYHWSISCQIVLTEWIGRRSHELPR